ncbi:MAG: cell division protein FtsB [Methylococcales bacterium]|nr:cell division protein FtsB [Methylococcales bacterium]
MSKIIVLVLLAMFVELQYLLWFDENGWKKYDQLQQRITTQLSENSKIQIKNQAISNDIIMVKNGLEGVETIAREELGMIKKGEQFYLIIQ